MHLKVKSSGPHHRRQKGSITSISIASDPLLLPSLEVIMLASPGSQISKLSSVSNSLLIKYSRNDSNAHCSRCSRSRVPNTTCSKSNYHLTENEI